MALIAVMSRMYSVLNPTSPSNHTICVCYCTRVYISLWTQGSVFHLKNHLHFIQLNKKIYSFCHVKFTYSSMMDTDFKSRLCTLSHLKKVHAVLSVRGAEKRETEQLLYRGVASFNNLCHIKNTFHARSFKRDFGGMRSFSLCSKTKPPRFNSAVCSNFILYTHQLLKHSSC